MTHFNRRWLDFRGRTMAEELGDGWCDGLPPGDDALREVGRAAREGRDSFEVDGRLSRHDGAYRWVRIHGQARRSEAGELLGYAGTGADVTEARVERQLLSLAVEAAPKELRKDERLSDSIVFVFTTSDDDRDIAAAYKRHVAGYIPKTDAGQDFLNLVTMLDSFVISVRFPKAA